MDIRDVTDNGEVGLVSTLQPSTSRQQADLATAVAASFFGVPSSRLPFSLAAAAETEANMAKRLEGAENFIQLAPNERAQSVRARQEKADDDEITSLGQMLQSAEQQREREEWARTRHSFGNTSMTGSEWQAMGDALRGDSDLRRWLLERIRRDGKSDTEARAIADRVAEVADIMALPASQRTEEQRRRLEEAQRNPAIQQYLGEAAERARNRSGFQSDRHRTAATGYSGASTSARADELSSFSSAPAVRTHYVRATVSPVPDVGPPSAPAAPPQPGMPSPAPSPGASGFDV